MAAGPTFEPLATTTLGSAASSITFSSIPSTYTDLRVVLSNNPTASTGQNVVLTFNNDTATNYSTTLIRGNGSVAVSSALTNRANMSLDNNGTSTTYPNLYELDIFSYAGSTYKTALVSNSSDFNGSGEVTKIVGLWRSTSAINRIDFKYATGSNFSTGTTATIYGIRAA